LRHDNADQRLSPLGREIGLVGDQEWERFNSKLERLGNLRTALESTRYKRSDSEYKAVSSLLGADLGDSFTLNQLSMRQGVDLALIRKLLPIAISEEVSERELETAFADSLYSGYVENHKASLNRTFQHDNLLIPESFRFELINGLSNEMVERLQRSSPRTFGQLRRIPGLTPAAISTVLVHLSAGKGKAAA